MRLRLRPRLRLAYEYDEDEDGDEGDDYEHNDGSNENSSDGDAHGNEDDCSCDCDYDCDDHYDDDDDDGEYDYQDDDNDESLLLSNSSAPIVGNQSLHSLVSSWEPIAPPDSSAFPASAVLLASALGADMTRRTSAAIQIKTQAGKVTMQMLEITGGDSERHEEACEQPRRSTIILSHKHILRHVDQMKEEIAAHGSVTIKAWGHVTSSAVKATEVVKKEMRLRELSRVGREDFIALTLSKDEEAKGHHHHVMRRRAYGAMRTIRG